MIFIPTFLLVCLIICRHWAVGLYFIIMDSIFTINNKQKKIQIQIQVCSYQFENVNEKLREMIHSLKENERWEILPDIEKYNQHRDMDPIFFVRCQSNGNFEPYQSYGNYSYCVDEKTGRVQDRPVLMEHASELPCCKCIYTLKQTNE